MPVTATSASRTSSTGSPGTSEAVWPSGPRPRWTRSRTGGLPAICRSVAAYWAAAAARSADSTGMAWICAARSGTRSRRLSLKWVRFRSGSPSGATRSSIRKTCTADHGTSASASARSMSQGVRPPLTARRKRPRAAAAARASSAIIAAARAATASGVSSTSISIGCIIGGSSGGVPRFVARPGIHLGVVPAARRHDVRIRFRRAPRAGIVFGRRRSQLQCGIDDAPCLFDVVFAGEQRLIARHGISQHALVGIHLAGSRGLAGDHLDRFAFGILLRRKHHHAEGDGRIGADAQTNVVPGEAVVRTRQRRFAESDQNFRRAYGQALSGAEIERYTLPAPGIHFESHGREGFHFRIGRHALLRAIAAELAAHDVVLVERRNRLQDLDLLIADGLAVRPDRGLHGQIRQDLEKVVLHDVPDGSGAIVEGAAALDAELLRHRDLNLLDVVAVPERLEKPVRKAEIHDVVDGPFPEVMIDAEDRGFREAREQNAVQLARGGEVRAEWLFDDHAAISGAARPREALDNGPKQHGGNGEIVRRPLRRAERVADRLKRGRIVVVAIHIAEQTGELLECGAVEPAVLFDALLRALAKLVYRPARPGHADHRHIEAAALDECLQRREDFLVSEVARGAEEDQRAGLRFIHDGLIRRPACRPVFRDARRTGSASPRESCPENRPGRAS